MKNHLWLLTGIIGVLFLIISCSGTEDPPEVNPFEEYLSEVDPSYSYELEETFEQENYTAYVLRMVSQNWLSEAEVNQTEWWHWVTIVVPDSVAHQTGLLWIGGGDLDTKPEETLNPLVVEAALATNSVTTHLHNVPFQPISFNNDEAYDERKEDEIIAYGWRKFLEGGANPEDAEWLARLPMTAAAQRAMDTVSDFTANRELARVDSFVVGGASKRGWTTWTTAIFDDRVVAITPAVIDLLNISPSFMHHWRAYGEWSPAIEDYENENIMNWQFTEEYESMIQWIDPFNYPDRLTLPKYLINAASDEFFLPDSWQFYWDDLPGEKNLRYVPNTGHDIGDTDAPASLISFYDMILDETPRPQFEWSVDSTGFRLELDPDNLPDELLLWNAQNPEARDFRLYVIDRIWIAKPLDIPEDGSLEVEIPVPEDGYSAWFVEATYSSGYKIPFKTTTGVVVTPDQYPFEEFVPDTMMVHSD
jgi:PhoPQ-activated pathogenicity-related protein